MRIHWLFSSVFPCPINDSKALRLPTWTPPRSMHAFVLSKTSGHMCPVSWCVLATVGIHTFALSNRFPTFSTAVVLQVNAERTIPLWRDCSRRHLQSMRNDLLDSIMCETRLNDV